MTLQEALHALSPPQSKAGLGLEGDPVLVEDGLQGKLESVELFGSELGVEYLQTLKRESRAFLLFLISKVSD